MTLTNFAERCVLDSIFVMMLLAIIVNFMLLDLNPRGIHQKVTLTSRCF